MNTHRALWTKDDVAEHLGVSTSTVDRYRRNDPEFPPEIDLGGQVKRWRPQHIEAWLDARTAHRTSRFDQVEVTL